MNSYLLIVNFLTLPIQVELPPNRENVSLDSLFQYNLDQAIHEKNGQKSLPFSLEALSIADELNNDEKRGKAYQEISFDYKSLGNFLLALENALKASDYYEKAKKPNVLGLIYDQIGVLYMNLGNYLLSRQYFQKAIANETNGPYPNVLGNTYNNLGENYRQNQQYDSAIVCFLKADQIYEKNQASTIRKAYAKCGIGLMYLHQQKTRLGDSIIHQAFTMLEQVHDYYGICVTQLDIAKMAFDAGDLTKAETYALQAYQLGKENHFNKELRDISLLLSGVAQKKNDFTKAYKYLAQYQVYKDSLVNDRVVSQMAEMRAEYEIGHKEKEISYLKTISHARTTTAWILTVGILLTVLLALFLYRLNQKRKVANNLLNDQNEELEQMNHTIHLALEEKEVLMKEIHHRVKNNLQIISSLISLQANRINNPEMLEIFNEMQRRILAISSIHQKLYQGDSVSLINMKDYLEEVVESIHSAFDTDKLAVGYEIAIQNVNLDIDAAVSIGLIVNELVTNSYKYAFKPMQNNYLVVGLGHLDSACCKLTVRDSGPGIAEHINITQSSSLGLRMVSLLTRQLNGKLEYKTDKGAVFSIVFEQKKDG